MDLDTVHGQVLAHLGLVGSHRVVSLQLAVICGIGSLGFSAIGKDQLTRSDTQAGFSGQPRGGDGRDRIHSAESSIKYICNSPYLNFRQNSF